MRIPGSGGGISEAIQLQPRDLLAVLVRRKWLIIIPLVLVTAGAVGSAYLIKPVFQSSATVLVGNPIMLSNDLQRMLGDFKDVIGGNADRGREQEDLQKEISSTAYVSQLVTRLQLDKDPAYDKKAQALLPFRPGMKLEDLRMELLVNDIRGRVKGDLVGKNYVRITVTSDNAVSARDLAKTLTDIFMEERQRQDVSAVNASSSFSYDQLAIFEKALQSKIDEKTKLEGEALQLHPEDAAASDANRKAITTEIQSTGVDIEERKTEERSLVSQLTTNVPAPIQLTDTPAITSKRQEINDFLGSMGSVIQKQLWNATSYMSMKVKLYTLEQDLDNLISKEVDTQFATNTAADRALLTQLFSCRERQNILYQQSNNLKLASTQINSRVNSLPEYQTRLDQLTRDINAARDLRDSFKKQNVGFQISQSLLEESRYRIMEPAKVPAGPIWPDKAQLGLIGLFIGLLIGGSAMFMAEFLDTSFKKIEDTEAFLGVPVIGTIPEIERLQHSL
jgi:uncharacterized protein involved in exopolysaccharide biosynthesis